MDQQLGEALIRWSIRLAVACYLIRVCLDFRLGRRCYSGRRAKKARWFWTLACVLYVFHVACAFGFRHHWSHAAAYGHTAEQTAAVTGIHWGGGLYFNYAFTAFWLADTVAWWQRGADSPYRSSSYFWTLHSVFAFMMVNATIVFGPPFWKWAGIFVVLLLAFEVRHRRTIAAKQDHQR